MQKRETIRELVGGGLTERSACRAVGLARSSYRFISQRSEELIGQEVKLREQILELARRHRRFGYRRITELLKRREWKLNVKRVWRIWKQEKLQVPRKRPRKRRSGESIPLPTRAAHRGHVWTYDFVFDRTERSAVLKMLGVLDEFTRECHRIAVGTSLDSVAVIEALQEQFVLHGAPEFLRSDNGGEFIADRVKQWLKAHGTQTVYIEPGHPWENPYAESFMGKFRDECLNEEIFWNVRDAQAIVERWRRHYNEERPHSSLGYRTPAEAARSSAASTSSQTATAEQVNRS